MLRRESMRRGWPACGGGGGSSSSGGGGGGGGGGGNSSSGGGGSSSGSSSSNVKVKRMHESRRYFSCTVSHNKQLKTQETWNIYSI